MEHQPLTYIYLPSGSAPANTLLLLHGTGGNENDLIPLAREFGTGFNILSLRGNVSEGGMPRFFRRLGMGIFDEQDLAFRTHEMVAFIEELAVKEGFDATKVIALGYSNGANIAGSALLLYPGFLAGAILYRPMQPFKDAKAGESAGASGSAIKANRRVPVFMSNGAADPTIQPLAAKAYAAILRNAGCDVSDYSLPAGHNLVQQDIQLSVEWFGAHFKCNTSK
jgi:phospholipase/carboxylesterase